MRGVDRSPGLFEGPPKLPDGFIYRPNFLSEAEEQNLIGKIQNIQLTPFKYYQFTGKRRTASFGWQYEFGTSDITTAPEIPAFLVPLRSRRLFPIRRLLTGRLWLWLDLRHRLGEFRG